MLTGLAAAAVTAAASLGANAMSRGNAAAASKDQYKYSKWLASDEFGYNMSMQRDAQDFNSTEARIARDWEAEMANTAYQRQRADLAAAGYNPLLAINSGGAATPTSSAASSGIGHVSGGTASAAQAQAPNIGSLISGIGSLANLGNEILDKKASATEKLSHAELLNQQSEESSARTQLTSAQLVHQLQENEAWDPEAEKRRRKYGDGPMGLVHSIGGVGDAVAKHASDFIDWLGSSKFKSAASMSTNSARSAEKRINGYNDALGDIMDKVMKGNDLYEQLNPKQKQGASSASSWLPSPF